MAGLKMVPITGAETNNQRKEGVCVGTNFAQCFTRSPGHKRMHLSGFWFVALVIAASLVSATRFFPSTSVFYQDISAAPLDAESDTIINSYVLGCSEKLSYFPFFSFLFMIFLLWIQQLSRSFHCFHI